MSYPKRPFIERRKKPIKQKSRKIKDSVQQRILFEELKRIVPHIFIKYNYPVRVPKFKSRKGFITIKYWGLRYIDVADIRNKIGFEYDGEQWHNTPRPFEHFKKDKRDRELMRAKWVIIHLNKYNFSDIISRTKTFYNFSNEKNVLRFLFQSINRVLPI